MAIQVQFIAPAVPMCDDPTTGKVIFRVRFSGFAEEIDLTELKAACAAFTHDFKLTRNHEPQFLFLIPRRLIGDQANLCVNIFHGSYIQKQMPHLIVGWEMLYYD